MQIPYGYPDERALAAAQAGEAVLGGCVIEEDAPVVQCRVCSHRPGTEMSWTGHAGPATGEFAGHRRILTEASVPLPQTGEADLIDFALSFDAYAALEPHAVRTIGNRARARFERSGELPENLVLLRTCLFFEQRAARFTDTTFDGPYVRALVAAIAEHAARERP